MFERCFPVRGTETIRILKRRERVVAGSEGCFPVRGTETNQGDAGKERVAVPRKPDRKPEKVKVVRVGDGKVFTIDPRLKEILGVEDLLSGKYLKILTPKEIMQIIEEEFDGDGETFLNVLEGNKRIAESGVDIATILGGDRRYPPQKEAYRPQERPQEQKETDDS